MRGIEFAKNKDTGHALADFNEAVRLNPNDHDAVMLRGDMYSEIAQTIRSEFDENPQKRGDDYFKDCELRSNPYLDLAIADYTTVLHLQPQFDPVGTYAIALIKRYGAKLMRGDERGGNADREASEFLIHARRSWSPVNWIRARLILRASRTG
jgi:tetratricopeptide (TPR) repeat protein